MINKNFEEITIDDINDLIENSVCESKTLEYKRTLNISNNEEKKEFLADISSFANSIGGDIVIGVEEDEKDKIPTNICGISYTNEDELVRKIESLIRDSIEPIILNIQCKIINIENKNCVLIIRIPHSLIAPHRIKLRNDGRFFARNNKGKYLMDVNELRLVFNSGLDLNKRIEEYKFDRYFSLIANKYNTLKNDSPIFVIHYIPVSVFNNPLERFAIKEIKQAMIKSHATAFGNSPNKNITIDGISMIHNQYGENDLACYKTNGVIEKVTTDWFEKNCTLPGVTPSVNYDSINACNLIDKLINDLNEIKTYYNALEISTPTIISCAVLNATNYTIPSKSYARHLTGKIDRDILCINDVYVEELSEKTEKILKPIFDSIWNACGYENCPAYDDEGNYTGLPN